MTPALSDSPFASEDCLVREAENLLVGLQALKTPEASVSLTRRLEELTQEISACTDQLQERRKSIAFVGAVGRGKSTAICWATKLMLEGTKPGSQDPVLATGGGHTTICEVHLRTSKNFGLKAEFLGEDELRLTLSDWSDPFFLPNDQGQPLGGSDFQYTSREIDRALRNMADLARPRSWQADQVDPAMELAKASGDQNQFIQEVMDRMALPNRVLQEIWFQPATDQQPLRWLKDTFAAVNNGRHPEFGLPRKIELHLPLGLLNDADPHLHIIDTKGMDGTSARADLQAHWDDSHTQIILCSSFNDAPEMSIQALLEHAKAMGTRNLSSKVALLILVKPGEADSMLDDRGESAESAAHAFALKKLEIHRRLAVISGPLETAFFDKTEETSDQIRHFLEERTNVGRRQIRTHLEDVLKNAKRLLDNQQHELAEAARKDVTQTLRTEIERCSDPISPTGHVEEVLMKGIRDSYAATVRASVRREGHWAKLDFAFLLGTGARAMAVASLQKRVEGFSMICRNLAAQDRYQPASDLVVQVDRVLQGAYDRLLRRMQDEGCQEYSAALNQAQFLWLTCKEEWGKGSGYIERVRVNNQRWFEDETARSIEAGLHARLQREWQVTLAQVVNLFES